MDLVELSDEEVSLLRISLLHYYWGLQHAAVAHRSEREDLNRSVAESIVVARGLLARLLECTPEQVPAGSGEDRCRGCWGNA